MKYLFSPSSALLIPEAALELYSDKPLEDLVEGSRKVFEKFTGPCESGKIRAADANGFPCWADDLSVTTQSKRESVLSAIDAIADKARSSNGSIRNGSISQLLEVEYQQVIEAHSRWYAEGYDEAKCPEEITAWANAEGISALQAASDIAEAAAHREEVIRRIRIIRLEGKRQYRLYCYRPAVY